MSISHKHFTHECFVCLFFEFIQLANSVCLAVTMTTEASLANHQKLLHMPAHIVQVLKPLCGFFPYDNRAHDFCFFLANKGGALRKQGHKKIQHGGQSAGENWLCKYVIISIATAHSHGLVW